MYLEWNRNESLLWNIADIIVSNEWFKRRKKIREGHLVRYNWKARILLNSSIEEDKDDTLVVYWVEKSGTVHYTNTRSGKSDSCDQVWLRHAKLWEN